MNIRNFKTLFSSVFALILGIVGLSLGFGIKSLIQYVPDVHPDSFLGNVRSAAAAYNGYLNFMVAAFAAIGFLCGVILGPKAADRIDRAGAALEQMSAKDKIAVVFGTLVGVAVTVPFVLLLARIPIIGIPISILLTVAFVYLGVRAAMSMKDEFRFIGAPVAAEAAGEVLPIANCKILDTNVIIDGRIADVCRAGFIEGTLYVPGFVLEELQHIADSGDSLKRARGRRGLDILNAMQKELPLVVRSWDKALDRSAQDDEVDTRLVKLAKVLEGAIVTNDFNLNKVAALQGVQVLNINELANALKPVVLPGEKMTVGIVKEGKEQNQGVAYLNDGTMIVVEDGRRHLNETLDVIVTSVLQTVAGKMIFARVRSDDEGDGFDYGREPRHDGADGQGQYASGGSGYTRRGQGRKIRQ